ALPELGQVNGRQASTVEMPFLCYPEKLVDSLCKTTLTCHPSAEGGVVDLSVVQRTDLIPYLVEAIRKILTQPVFEDLADGSIEPDDRHPGSQRAMFRGGTQNIWNLMVVEARYYGRVHNADRHAGSRKRFDGSEPSLCARRPRLHHRSQFLIECCNGDIYLHQLIPGQVLKNIQIAQYEAVLRNHRDGVPVTCKDLQHRTGNPELPLEGLIAVCVSRKHNRNCVPLGMQDEFFQQLARVLLNDNLTLEIQAGTKTPTFVRIACIAIDASVLTALIRIE